MKANKKIVALKSDRYVVDATQIRTGKVNLSDLLRDVPGVTNDRGNLSILGKNAVKIMINGRLRQVSGDQVEDLLKSYSASEVQKIEVIYHTGAEFDAAGNYGILNFVMKKPKQNFFGGNASESLTISDYASNETSLNLKYNRKKLISYLSVGYDYLKEYGWQTTDYYYTSLTRNSRSENWDKQSRWQARLGMDYQVDSLSTLSLEGSFSDNHARNTVEDVIRSSYSDAISGDLQISNSWRKLPQRYWDISFYADRKWSKNFNTSLALDYYNRREEQDYTFLSEPYDSDMSKTEEDYHFFNDEYRHLKGFSYALDMTWQMPSEYLLKAGTKGSFSQVKNESSYDYSNMDTQDNVFDYDEDCLAAYLVLTKTFFDALDLRLGGRYEHTFTKGVSDGLADKNDYGRLFPDLRVSYRFKGTNQLSLAYRGGITRPWMSWLNPFRIYSSPYMAREGTPDLRPNCFYNVELVYQKSFSSGFFRLQGRYSYGDDEMAEVNLMEKDGTSLYKWANAYERREWMASYMLYYGGLRWMRMTLMGYLTHSNPKVIGGYEGNAVKSTSYSNNLQLSFIFDRKQRFTGSLFGSIMTPRRTPFEKIGVYGFLRGGVNYVTLNDKWNFGVYVYNMIPHGTSGTYYSSDGMRTDYRDHSARTAVCLSVSYTFGKDIQEKYKQSSGADVKARF